MMCEVSRVCIEIQWCGNVVHFVTELLVMIASFAVFPHTDPLAAGVSGWGQVG